MTSIPLPSAFQQNANKVDFWLLCTVTFWPSAHGDICFEITIQLKKELEIFSASFQKMFGFHNFILEENKKYFWKSVTNRLLKLVYNHSWTAMPKWNRAIVAIFRGFKNSVFYSEITKLHLLYKTLKMTLLFLSALNLVH